MSNNFKYVNLVLNITCLRGVTSGKMGQGELDSDTSVTQYISSLFSSSQLSSTPQKKKEYTLYLHKFSVDLLRFWNSFLENSCG